MYEDEINELMPTLGAEFAELFVHAKHDLFLLRQQWRFYKSFFGTNRETVDLLNGVSGTTSLMLERTLFEATILGLRRISDKPVSKGNKKSVTIRAFPQYFEGDERKELQVLVGKVINKCEPARHWSDKKIAHSDLAYRSGILQLMSINRQIISEAVDALADVIKWISKTKLNVTQVTHPIPRAEDENWFLKHIYEGKLSFDEKKRLSKEYTHLGRYSERKALYEFPEWLNRDDPPMDVY